MVAGAESPVSLEPVVLLRVAGLAELQAEESKRPLAGFPQAELAVERIQEMAARTN